MREKFVYKPEGTLWRESLLVLTTTKEKEGFVVTLLLTG